MKTPTAIPGFTFTKKPYPELVADFLAIQGWESELLGLSTKGHEIYGFTYGDVVNKPVMHVHGNIHGLHEWRTCYWVSQFMRYLHDPSSLAADTANAIEELKEKYSFSFIPATNPDGYVDNTYHNGNGIQLNRNFGDSIPARTKWEWGPADPTNLHYRGTSAFSEVETQYIRDRVLALRPVSFMDNHTWGDQEGFKTIESRVYVHQEIVAETHVETMKALGISPDGDSVLGASNSQGLAGNWGSATESSIGTVPVSITFESGGGWTEERQAQVGMTGILYHMLGADSILPQPEPDPDPPIPHDGKPITFPTSWGPVHLDGQDYLVASVDTYVNGDLARIWP